MQLDEAGEPILVPATELVAVVDSEGNPVLGDDGEALMEEVPMLDAAGNPVPARRIYSDHLFIHRASAYFD